MKEAYRMLNHRIGIFASLPLRTLDQLTLQRRFREIGDVRALAAIALARWLFES
jgi:hypothetical protein